MRDIKFRAWDAVNKEMISNSDLPNYYDLDLLLNVNDGITTFMQFTGLMDKNGVEIYEGDIVVDDIGNGFNVYYDKNDAAFALECDGYQDYRLHEISNYLIEVIGNIHQNPELLGDNNG